ncbi:MAG: hypothetical protein ACREUX_00405, partial [Burkholderiales bacterium]
MSDNPGRIETTRHMKRLQQAAQQYLGIPGLWRERLQLPLVVAVLLTMVCSVRAADTWPSRPIRLIAPFPAGSSV